MKELCPHTFISEENEGIGASYPSLIFCDKCKRQWETFPEPKSMALDEYRYRIKVKELYKPEDRSDRWK